MPLSDANVQDVRAFSRFYTRLMGLLNRSILDSPFSLAEARVLFEINLAQTSLAQTSLAQTSLVQTVRASDLASGLAMDPAQLSRTTARFSKMGLMDATPDPADKRARTLSLTKTGLAMAADLRTQSNAQASAVLASLSVLERRTLSDAFKTVRLVLSDNDLPNKVVYRDPLPGDYSWASHRQAVLYNIEYDWDETFEHLLLEIYRDFVGMPAPKRMIIAELDGIVAGSLIVLPGDTPDVAKLRLLYVEPFARQRGIAKRLVAEAMAFSTQAGFKTLTLWTQDCLTSARKIYQSAGFKLESEATHTSFGVELNGQYWTVPLT